MLDKKNNYLVEIENLYKKYSAKSDYSIEDISINGTYGEIIGILGHNGAGKSTTIKCMTGIHPYQQGTIEICGFDMKKNPIQAKQNFGYVADEFTLFEKMTGQEYVNFLADIYKVSAEDRKQRTEELLNTLALGDSFYKMISSYSHGMKQKISIMGAIIHNPKVFILDEPMVGLDPYSANQLKLFIKDYAEKGNLVLFSSHNLDAVEKLCNRVYIIDQGKILEEIDMKSFASEKKDFEEYFLSITKREAKVWGNF